LFALNGCGVTYPKESLKESIVRICKNEYKVDVKVATIGKTIVIYLPLENLMDFTFAVTKEAGEKINDVILSVARVALSTDAQFDFYCVIAHDVRIPEIQIVIIKSVEDVKRLLLNDISRGEYSKRVLIDLRLNPQSQKERSVKDVFRKMGLDDKWQEQVMNDFFRAEPTVLSDIGYWNKRFYIKDITLPEFLAEQMASRVRIEFREDKALVDGFNLKSAKGAYIPTQDGAIFRVEVLVEPKLVTSESKQEAAKKVLSVVVPIAAHVVHTYRFSDFSRVEIVNANDGSTVRISKEALEDFRTKKLKLEDLLKQGQD